MINTFMIKKKKKPQNLKKFVLRQDCKKLSNAQ